MQTKQEIEKIEKKEFMSKKDCKTSNYIEHLLNLYTVITGCVFISDFASLVSIPKGLQNYCAVGLNSLTTAGIKKYKSAINKKKKKMVKFCACVLFQM